MKKILFIDDDRILRHSVSDFLAASGSYEVVVAKNGLEGVHLAHSDRPDLILCDVMMPQMDGYGVLQKLQEESSTASIPFIFLTAQSDRSSIRHGMELGADDYIAKPFTSVELESAIQARFTKQKTIKTQYEEKMEALRGNILLAMPHELRSPLSVIIGYSDILASDSDLLPPAQVRQLSEAICRSGHRLHHLVENYLIYAQIELLLTQPERIERMRGSAAIVADEVVSKSVTKQLEGNGRSVQRALSAAHVKISISDINLEKIVEELVDNALKFSPTETAVFITSQVVKNNYHLCIHNEGRGMTPDQIENIGGYMQFERKIHEQQGSGMGLVIVQRLVELYGGSLHINSVPNRKTAVEVRLPLAA